MKVLNKGKLKILSWCNLPDEECLKQASNLANHPLAFKHICLMPDTHVGYGMPIGGVAALQGAISPNMVGVDIGCGMCAVKTSVEASSLTTQELKKILAHLRAAIPVGFKHHSKHTIPKVDELPSFDPHAHPIIRREERSILEQLGTLGGGNHFIELQKDTAGLLWFMLHSGSRNLGLQVANHYNQLAIQINEHNIPKEWQLATLASNKEAGILYQQEMDYCLKFAKKNRQVMASKVREALNEVLGSKSIQFLEEVNIHHNYAAKEEHFGEKVFIHRKGATSARMSETGIIPGSQGTSSYIVKGKGNPLSFMSCSHGAGRVMGREEAKRRLNLEVEQQRLEQQGIIHAVRSRSSLEEAPSAYKDIDEVMSLQSDLVDIVYKLQPLAVIKG
ncbi:MAG: RtcB family protein [Oligoflexia bacterium]|nr:RtcB family protein [Oligoflexia bacterium]MBF0365394.1 RtcB family protein [Oligoflexia bacterium]